MERNMLVQKMIDNMEKVMVGKGEVLELAIVTLLAGGNLLLEDVPGVGKTTLAKALAKTMGIGFSRIQFTPDTLPGDVTGVNVYHMKEEKFEYVKGAIMNHIVLADEINRTSPKTQAALLEAMEEGQVTVDGVSHSLPNPFMLIATQNPIDYLGTYYLPEAQLDRFLMKVSLGYPAHEDEMAMIGRFLSDEPLTNLEPVITKEELLHMKAEVAKVIVRDEVASYALSIVEKTRDHEHVRLGASPRATLAFIRAAKSVAHCSGRDYVIPDDIRKVAIPVLSHRLVLTPQAKAVGMTADKIIAAILTMVRVPI